MSPTVVWDHCLFEQDCEAVAIDWGMKFRADDNFATKGCFTKNGKGVYDCIDCTVLGGAARM